jgi:membrane-bound lytic murein transglycosylase MltF
MKTIKALNNAAGSADAKRFEQTIALFKQYGDKYNFDSLMLAAQGYQESTLDQSKKSHVGAIGIMQIMPATGQALKVGDINVAESNIHGGAKYMDQLMTQYFKDAKFDEQNRTLFAFAGYNAGPGNISKMRKEAERRGLDPDKWFNNVEVVTAEKIGIETTTYVRNIFKYYVSYKLTQDAQANAARLRQQIAPARIDVAMTSRGARKRGRTRVIVRWPSAQRSGDRRREKDVVQTAVTMVRLVSLAFNAALEGACVAPVCP